MSATYKIAVVVGSLRKASLNRKAALAFQSVAPPELSFEMLEIGDLPLYNEELEGDGTPRLRGPAFAKRSRPATAWSSSRPSTTAACRGC